MEDKLQKILNLVDEYIQEKQSSKTWQPGKDWVQYSGPYFSSEEYRRTINTFLKGWLVLGNEAMEFEKKFPPHLGKNYGVVTNSGSSANLLMVASLASRHLYNLPKGTEIIVPVAGFPTTLNPVLQMGFSPVFVDIELDTLNINLDDLENGIAKNIDSKAKVVMFAHVLGNPPNMDKLLGIVKQNNLILLEDCCDALGSTYRGAPLGSFGAMSSCSFYPAHHITMGEGGFVACETQTIEKVIRSLREWGRGCYCNGLKANLSKKGTCGCRYSNWLPAFPKVMFDHKYVYEEIGYNLKPIELQCSMGLAQLTKVSEIKKKRVKNYTRLFNIFQPYEEFFILPKAQQWSDPSWFAFPLTIKNCSPFNRFDICGYLEDNKIQTRNYFGGNLMLQPAYQKLSESVGLDKVKLMFPNATKATTDTFFLGTSPVITDEQLDYIQEMVNKFMKRYVPVQS